MKVHLSGPAITVVLLVKHVYLGAGYLTGQAPKPDSGFFSVALQVASIHTWGWLILVGAAPTVLALGVPSRCASLLNLVAVAPMAVFAVFLLVAELLGRTPRFGSAVLFLVPVALHLLLATEYWRTPLEQEGST